MATAEFAVAMPAVVLVLALSLSALAAGLDQIRCVDAARPRPGCLRGERRTAPRGGRRGAGPRRLAAGGLRRCDAGAGEGHCPRTVGAAVAGARGPAVG